MNEHDLELVAGGSQDSLEKSGDKHTEPYAVFGASRDFYITSDQFDLLKDKKLVNKDGKLLYKDAPEAAKILGIKTDNLRFMTLNYKAPEFAKIDIIK